MVRWSKLTQHRLQFGTDPQEANAIASPGKPAPFPESGTEDPRIWGTLTTKGDTPFDANVQVQVDGGLAGKLFAGKYPSLPGSYGLYYQDVVDTIRGRSEVKVKPETSRDGLRVIELARESHLTGRTMPWS